MAWQEQALLSFRQRTGGFRAKCDFDIVLERDKPIAAWELKLNRHGIDNTDAGLEDGFR